MATVPAPPANPAGPIGRNFILGVFVIGAIVTVAVGYLGVAGALNGGIVGTQHTSGPASPDLATCQGHGGLGTFHFSLVSNAKGQGSFNASTPGPCFAVAVGSQVTMNFSVEVGSNQSNSWALIGPTGPVTQAPVFTGAGWTNATATTGIRMGESHLFSFTASAPGAYRYVSQVANHAAAGMWGPFNVTAQPLASVGAAGQRASGTATSVPVQPASLLPRMRWG